MEREDLRNKALAAEKAAKQAQVAAQRAVDLAKEAMEFAKALDKKAESKSVTSSDDSSAQPQKDALMKDAEKKGAKAPVESDSSSSASSDSDSDGEVDAARQEAKKTEAKGENTDSSSDSSGSSSDDDSDGEVDAALQEAKKAEAKGENADSSSDSSDSSSDDEEEKQPEQKVVADTKKEKADDDGSSSSDSSSDSESESDDDDKAEEQKMEEAQVTPKKRKQDDVVMEKSSPKRAAVSFESDTTSKVYIRGLPWRAAENEVYDFFAACGPIKSCELPLQDDGRSSGTAIVEFETAGGAAAAIELNGNDFQGRWLSIKYSTPKTITSAREPTHKEPGCCTVFVGNLSWEIDEDTLRHTFAECGEISAIRFATDRESGEFKGFGHIEFADTASTDKAVAMAGTDIMGRAVRVDFANERKRNSFGGDRGGPDRGGRGYMGGSGDRGRGRGRGGGGRGGGGRGGGGRGGGRSNGFAAKKNGSIAAFSGNKITFG